MENHFSKITTKEALDELLARSNSEPVALFKHSTSCPISATAFREMEDFPGQIALLEVQRARELSDQIGQQTGVQHESPQVIILRNGRAVWHASHWKVTAQAVAQAMSEHA